MEALQQVKASLGLILRYKKEQAVSQRAVIEGGKSAKKRGKKASNKGLRGRKTQQDLLKATKKRTENTGGGIIGRTSGLDTAEAGIQSCYVNSVWTVSGRV